MNCSYVLHKQSTFDCPECGLPLARSHRDPTPWAEACRISESNGQTAYLNLDAFCQTVLAILRFDRRIRLRAAMFPCTRDSRRFALICIVLSAPICGVASLAFAFGEAAQIGSAPPAFYPATFLVACIGEVVASTLLLLLTGFIFRGRWKGNYRFISSTVHYSFAWLLPLSTAFLVVFLLSMWSAIFIFGLGVPLIAICIALWTTWLLDSATLGGPKLYAGLRFLGLISLGMTALMGLGFIAFIFESPPGSAAANQPIIPASIRNSFDQLLANIAPKPVAPPPKSNAWRRWVRKARLHLGEQEYDRAISCADSALAAAEDEFGFDHPNVGYCLLELGSIYELKGEFSEVEPLYRRALVIIDNTFGPNSGDAASCLTRLASLYEQWGGHPEAESFVQRGLTLNLALHGPNHLDVATCLSALGRLTRISGDHALAQQLLDRAMSIRTEKIEKSEIDQIVSNCDLARGFVSHRLFDAAEPVLKTILSFAYDAPDSVLKAVTDDLRLLAIAYELQGEHRKAIKIIRVLINDSPEAPEACERYLAEQLRFEALKNMAFAEYWAAERILERQLAIKKELSTADDPFVIENLVYLAEARQYQGRHEQAALLYKRMDCKQAIELCKDALARNNKQGSTGRDQAMSLMRLAGLHCALGQFSEAEQFYSRARDAVRPTNRLNRQFRANIMRRMAWIYECQGNFAQAETLYQESLSHHERVLGDHHVEVVMTLNNLAALYRKQRRLIESEAQSQRAYGIAESLTIEEKDIVLVPTFLELASTYRLQQKNTEAEALYRRALSCQEDSLGPDHVDVAATCLHLAFLYEAMGQPESATAMEDRASTILARH